MEPQNLDSNPQHPEFYPALNHSLSAITAVPSIRELAYFKIQALRYPDVTDVY